MKFNVKRSEFLKAVTVASKFVPTSSPNPVLLDLALVLNEKGLMLYGGNGDVYLETCIPFVKDDKDTDSHTYIATLYKDGVAIAEKETTDEKVSFKAEIENAGTGTYKVSVVVKGDAKG